jgi:hypothetical protein
MRPAVKRRLLTLAAAASLLLCVPTVALWVRSYFISDGWMDSRADRVTMAWSERGTIFLQHTTRLSGRVATPVRAHRTRWELPPVSGTPIPEPGTVRDWKFLGFHWFISIGGSATASGGVLMTPPRWTVGIPLWCVAVLSALLPLRWLLRIRGGLGPGHCRKCGYDLRATPDRCPECGDVPAAR